MGSLDSVEHTESYRVLKGLREECYTITVRLRSANEFKEMPNVYTLKAAKFLYNIITNRQNITVLKMIQWLDTHDLSPQLYVGDGVYAERRQGSLEALNEYLQLSCGESIQVVHKELNRTIDEAKILGHKERVGELYLDTLWGPPRVPGENLLAFRGQTQVKDLNFNDINVHKDNVKKVSFYKDECIVRPINIHEREQLRTRNEPNIHIVQAPYNSQKTVQMKKVLEQGTTYSLLTEQGRIQTARTEVVDALKSLGVENINNYQEYSSLMSDNVRLSISLQRVEKMLKTQSHMHSRVLHICALCSLQSKTAIEHNANEDYSLDELCRLLYVNEPVSITIHSLHRLITVSEGNLDRWGFTEIVVDEFVEVMSNIACSVTSASHRVENHNVFQRLINQAKNVFFLCADMNIDDRVKVFLENDICRFNLFVDVYGQSTVAHRITVVEQKDFLRQLDDNVENKRVFAIPCNQRQNAATWKEYIKQKDPECEVLLYTSEEGRIKDWSDGRVRDRIKQARELKNGLAIIYTSTAGLGVSETEPIDSLLLDYRGNGGPSGRTWGQMTKRLRNLTGECLMMTDKVIGQITTHKDAAKAIDTSHSQLKNAYLRYGIWSLGLVVEGELNWGNSSILDLHVYNKREELTSSTILMMRCLTRQGYEIVVSRKRLDAESGVSHHKKDVKGDKSQTQQLKTAKDTVVKTNLDSIVGPVYDSLKASWSTANMSLDRFTMLIEDESKVIQKTKAKGQTLREYEAKVHARPYIADEQQFDLNRILML